MASRKLVRDYLITIHPLYLQLTSQRRLGTRLPLLSADGYASNRQFSVLNEISKRIKGEAEKNPEFKKSVEELKEKAEELKGVKEDLKVRTKQTTEQLYKHVDGVWTEAEATAKKVSANVKEKISATTEEVKESLGIGKQDFSQSGGGSARNGSHTKDQSKASSGEETHQQPGSNDAAQTIFGKFMSSFSSPKVSGAFEKLKEAKVADLAKKGYDIVKDELSGTTSKRKHLEYTPTTFTGERSTRTDVVILPSKQSRWGKKWESFKEKMKGNPMFKRISGYSEPVVNKGQEIAEDVRERWETSDNPVVHKIQDVGETIFQETDTAQSIKEIRRRDPSFSLPDFVAEIQEVIRPVLKAYFKGNVEELKKYCSPEVIERCKAEHQAFQSHNMFFDYKILHISEAEVRETKMMGTSPIIIVAFQTQQIYCVRDREGLIKEGGEDTIHTVYYAWAMQQVNPEELGEGAIYPIWRLREMQQLGVKALI
ncbi:mitochondrial import inner membrane translocase subunit TIM44-2-like isoform X2 [Rutidosis leptorrhynchoides]|uniref:mitochondrial import inner membrane translocase subunit TIM44-2-like isoform X2 n=1 Tax=Rutidosis leptorrhynchoides TaxID=125765 RepID=UPI003A994196